MMLISIHAPREGSDPGGVPAVLRQAISIHAPREGSDLPGNFRFFDGGDFNPRSP